jgi:hypothetical protein
MGAPEDARALEILLEIMESSGSSYQLTLTRNVPLLLIPQFQPGREFQIRIDPGRENEVSFVSYSTPEGQVVDLSSHNR